MKNPQGYLVASVGLAVALIGVTLSGAAYRQARNQATMATMQQEDSVQHGITCGGSRKEIPDTAAATWTTWEIPEFQDKQKFWDNATGNWGPLACIVAADKLDTVSLATFRKGVLAGMAYVYGEPATNTDYTGMGLTKLGYHCIFLRYVDERRSAADARPPLLETRFENVPTGVTLPAAATGGPGKGGPRNGWVGLVKPVTPAGCGKAEGVEMAGYRATHGGSPRRDYPPVMRFIMDSTDKPALGVMCHTGWCVLGGDASKLPKLNHAIAGTAGQKVRRQIFGWYDDQILTISSGTPTNLVQWQRVTVIPDENLARYHIADFEASSLPVATVILSGESKGKYLTKWGFKGNGFENKVKFKKVSATNWEVWVNGTLQPQVHVKWNNHGTAAFLAATARWVWQDTDDGMWVKCDFGCCDAEA